MNSIPQRIKYLINKYNLNVAAFEKQIGASNSTIASAINKDSNISGGILNKILIRYTEISPDWLMTGTGPMLRNSPEVKENVQTIADKDKIIASQDIIISLLQKNLADCEASKKSD